MDVRPAHPDEVPLLARIWYDAWQDAHARLLPAELVRARTLESLHQRMEAALLTVRVAGPPEAPVGFCMLKGDELYQLYVAREARGTGAAAALMADAEARLAASGFETAWLACAIGNDRAARFYEKSGWRCAGIVVSQLETPEGVIPLEVLRYEKDLTANSALTPPSPVQGKGEPPE